MRSVMGISTPSSLASFRAAAVVGTPSTVLPREAITSSIERPLDKPSPRV